MLACHATKIGTALLLRGLRSYVSCHTQPSWDIPRAKTGMGATDLIVRRVPVHSVKFDPAMIVEALVGRAPMTMSALARYGA